MSYPGALLRAALVVVTLVVSPALNAETASEMDRRAQGHFDNKEYDKAVALWLSVLDIEPENEKVQQKIELVYEVKQKSDLAFQRSRSEYRIARPQLRADEDAVLESGISTGRNSMKEYVTAYRLAPLDLETRRFLDNMKILEAEIKAAEEKLRLSRAKREKIMNLRIAARTEMKLADPNYETALGYWKEILSYMARDVEALEGKRNCELAIANRLKFERIRGFMARGRELFDAKQYKLARPEFEQIIALDVKNREARDYIEKIDELLEERRNLEQRRQQAEALYQSGLANLNNNNFDQAEEDLNNVISLIKEYKDAPQRLKTIPELRKRYEQNQRDRKYQRITQRFQEGIIAYTVGRYKDAINAFVEVVALDRDNLQAKEYLQRARDGQKLQEEETVDENSPYYDIVQSLIIAGRRLYELGNIAESKKKWDHILKLFPSHRIAKEYLIRCDLRIDPSSKDTMLARRMEDGNQLMNRKDYRGAFKVYELVQSVDRNYPGLTAALARAQEGMRAAKEGDITPADRNEITRRYNTGMGLYQAGGKDNIEKALAEFRWVVRKDPNNVRAVITMNKIEAQLRMNVPEAAQRARLTPRQQEMVNQYYYRGINYYSTNQFQKAVQEWQKVLAIDPDNVKAKNNIRKVLALIQR